MDTMNTKIEQLTTQKNDLEKRIGESSDAGEINNNPGEKSALKCALDRVHKSLGELNVQKFFLGSSNDKNKSEDGLSKFIQ